MKRLLFVIVTATCLLSACASHITEESVLQNESKDTAIEQTEKSWVKTEQPQTTQIPKPIIIPTATPAFETNEQVMEELTPTIKPTAEPTKAPTPTITPAPQPIATSSPKPTAEPIPTPEPESEITPVSSAFINAAMAEINKQREVDGAAPAIFSSSISASCKNHAIAMAESGEAFHASGIYMYEVVARVSKVMPGATMGSSAVAHVVQLKSDEVTQIGIGAVYCGNYLYYVIRGN